MKLSKHQPQSIQTVNGHLSSLFLTLFEEPNPNRTQERRLLLGCPPEAFEHEDEPVFQRKNIEKAGQSGMYIPERDGYILLSEAHTQYKVYSITVFYETTSEEERTYYEPKPTNPEHNKNVTINADHYYRDYYVKNSLLSCFTRSARKDWVYLSDFPCLPLMNSIS
jgi:hypothetical protein